MWVLSCFGKIYFFKFHFFKTIVIKHTLIVFSTSHFIITWSMDFLRSPYFRPNCKTKTKPFNTLTLMYNKWSVVFFSLERAFQEILSNTYVIGWLFSFQILTYLSRKNCEVRTKRRQLVFSDKSGSPIVNCGTFSKKIWKKLWRKPTSWGFWKRTI